MKYSIVKTTIEVEGQTTDTYGICGNGVRVEDVSLDKVEVERLLNTINDLGDVAPEHLFDICEDYVEYLA